jgi:signal peptidase II
LRVIYFTFGVIFIDQISKFYIKGIEIPFLHFSYFGMYPGESISVIGNLFKITFIENPGMAFGFNPGSEFKLWITIFSLIASIGLLVYLYIARNRSLSLRIALAMILGGAIGNSIDRTFYGILYGYAPVFYGRVVDFFDFDFFNFTIFGRNYDRWPIFNLADVSVTTGVIILLLFYQHHTKEGIEPVDEEPRITSDNIRSNLNDVVDEGKISEDDLAGRTEDDQTDK